MVRGRGLFDPLDWEATALVTIVDCCPCVQDWATSGSRAAFSKSKNSEMSGSFSYRKISSPQLVFSAGVRASPMAIKEAPRFYGVQISSVFHIQRAKQMEGLWGLCTTQRCAAGCCLVRPFANRSFSPSGCLALGQ